MNYTKDNRFYKFFIPSLIGAILFVVPINQNGNLTIPIAVAANALLELMGEHVLTIIWALISISAIMTLLHKFLRISILEKNSKMEALFSVKGFWFWIRMVGFLFINMIYFDFGPQFIIGDLTGGLVANDLIPILVCVFLLAGILLALLLNYGLLDFCGALLIKIMRPVFNLPGRSALDCVASWLGDGSIGVLLTSKQYEEGFYSKREATVVATTFSAVSITFSLVVISQVGLEHMFLPFYLVVSAAGIVAAIIVPKLPPLSKIPDTYNVETTYSEDIPEGKTPAQYGIELALRKAENAPGIAAFFKEGIENVFEMWFGTLPVILAIGTVAGTSVTQLIYMSEIGSIIMGSKIPVSLTNLFIIFVERTIVTLPIVAILAHLLF